MAKINNLIKNLHLYFLMLLLVIILVGNLFYTSFNQTYIREGVDPLPQSHISVTLTDTSKTKPVPSLTGIFEIGTNYDASMTPFLMNTETDAPVTLAPEVTIIIKPVKQDISANTTDLSSNTGATRSVSAGPRATTGPAPKTVDIFPSKFKIVMLFDKKGPKYYLSQKEKTNTLNSQNELQIYTLAAAVTDSNYKQIGNISVDTYNPYLYTLSITDGTSIESVKINYSTTSP